jgi:two-component system, NtrC family, sensor histidine kinase HydH
MTESTVMPAPRPAPDAAAPPRDLQAFNLTRWFALVALASIAALALAIGVLLNWFIADRLMHQQAELTTEFVQSLMLVETPMIGYFADPSHGMNPDIAASFRHISVMPDVLRANVYDLKQQVIWSSDPALIGRRFGRNRELEEALDGEVVAHRGHNFIEHGKVEHESLHKPGGVFLEIYVPVHDAQGQRVLGVIEFYKTPRGLTASLQQLHRYVLVGSVLAASFLYLAMFGLIRRADHTMRRQQNQLLENETMAVIGEMSSAVAHGIRNPLASIRSSAELVQEGIPELTQDAATDVISECDRLEAWVNELLSYTHPMATNMAAVALPDLLQACLAESERELRRRGLSVETDWDPSLPAVRGNALLLGQVLRSLLSNAMEACGREGRIRVRARHDETTRRVRLSVGDDGAGMNAAQLREAGKPFFSTKPRGLGVGLALARRVIERLGGTFEIDSAPGQGTVVHFCLPAE